MINVDIFIESGNISKYAVKGHAGYAQSGEDIVCAAVSAVCQATLMGLLDVVNIDVKYTVSDGYLECEIPLGISQAKRREADVLLKTMSNAIEDIARQHKKFVSLHKMEV